MYNKIVTHRPLHHADDFVGVCLLKANRINAEIETVAPQDPRLLDWRDDPEIALVDVGRCHDPHLYCFDHHHDPELECSAVLVARAMGYQRFAASSAAHFMTTKDLFGIDEASKVHHYTPNVESARNERILVNLGFGKTVVQAVATSAANCTVDMGYDEFVLQVLRRAGAQAVGRAKSRIVAQNHKTREALKRCELVEHGPWRVVISQEVVSSQAALAEYKAHLVISPDTRDPRNTAITTRLRESPAQNVDLSRASEAFGMQQVFLHNGGFISVLKGTVADPKSALSRLLG